MNENKERDEEVDTFQFSGKKCKKVWGNRNADTKKGKPVGKDDGFDGRKGLGRLTC